MSTSVTNLHVEPVRKTIRVDATPERAFDVFTAGMGRWWLPSHSTSRTGSPIAAVVMEPRAGGRWFERGADGTECDWGRVLVWSPPTRLVLAWQLSATWEFDPQLQTEVELRFEACGDGRTEVSLEHRGLERYGEASATVRAAVDSPNGWGGLLESYAGAFS
jgi:uncharacterized protein YndB with AHSA1/START domain